MKRLLLPLGLAALLPAGALAQPGPVAQRPTPRAASRHQAALCPIHVPGAQASSTATATGAELTITAPAEGVEQVREQARTMAARLNDRPAGRPARGVGGSGAGGMSPIPPASVSVADVTGGARLVFEPQDRARADELRAAVAQHAQTITTGICPMPRPAPR